MMGCARIGASTRCVRRVQPGFAGDRIVDSTCQFLVTTDGVMRGRKRSR